MTEILFWLASASKIDVVVSLRAQSLNTLRDAKWKLLDYFELFYFYLCITTEVNGCRCNCFCWMSFIIGETVFSPCRLRSLTNGTFEGQNCKTGNSWLCYDDLALLSVSCFHSLDRSFINVNHVSLILQYHLLVTFLLIFLLI